MAKKKESFWARSVGNGLAHLQDGIDHICEYGFATVRTIGDKPVKKKKNEHKYVHQAKKFGKGFLSFLGNVGDAYYDKYEKLKSQKEDT